MSTNKLTGIKTIQGKVLCSGKHTPYLFLPIRNAQCTLIHVQASPDLVRVGTERHLTSPMRNVQALVGKPL